ncbi:MAG: hypothetical protein KIS92_09880 [Planctomycetota bacterium]|nr:hypothetical protein [Planctomycetota bacterium]
MRRLRPLCLLLVLAPVLWVPILRAEEPTSYNAPEFKEGDAAYTKEEAEALVAEILPLVERAAGRRFKAKPKIVWGTRDRIAASMAHDLLPQVRKLHPAMSASDAANVAVDHGIGAAPLLLARYSYADGDLCFCPTNPISIFETLKVDVKEIMPVLKLVTAFELTYALQDQELGLAKLLKEARDGESSMALNMALKGHAAWVMLEVAKELKTPDATRDFAKSIVLGVILRKDPALDRTADAFYKQIYGDALSFVKFQAEKGGTENVWKVLAQPPVETRMLAKPETYAPQTRAFRDYAAVLEGIEKDLDGKEEKDQRSWQIQRMALGPAMMRTAYAGLDDADRELLAQKFEAGQSLVAVHRPSAVMASFTLLIFKDAESARKACGILEAFTKKELARKAKEDPIVKIDGPETSDLKGLKAETARRMTIAVDVPGEPLMRQQVVRIARGRNVLEYVDQNLGLAPERVAELADKLLKKLEDLLNAPERP